MNEDSYLEMFYEDAYILEPLDGYGDEPLWDDESEWDDDPSPYDGDYSEE